jgi:hypothetical protein
MSSASLKVPFTPRRSLSLGSLGSSGRDKRLSYACLRRQIEYGGEACQSPAGGPLGACVGEQVLRVLEPSALELSPAAADQIRRGRDRLDRHRRQRLERAGYEVDRAARQHHAVDPENRLVARALERQWEVALRAQREVEESSHRFRSQESQGLARGERDMVRRLAADIPELWSSATTTAADRQALVRHLVEKVVVATRSDTEFVDVTIPWAGGAPSRHEVIRPVARYEQLRDYGRLVARIAALRAGGLTAGQIAERLNEEGWWPPRRRTTFHVRWCASCSPDSARSARGRRPSGRPGGCGKSSGGSQTWLASWACPERRSTAGCATDGSTPGNRAGTTGVGSSGPMGRDWTA